MKVREVLSGPDKWYKGYFAATATGFKAEALDHEACKWCLIGACLKATNRKNLEDGQLDKLSQTILKLYPRIGPEALAAGLHVVPYFNDHYQTTWEMVDAVLNEANI